MVFIKIGTIFRQSLSKNETILILLKKVKVFVEICISNHYITSERNAKNDIRKRQLTKV